MLRLYIPADSVACAVGADALATRLQQAAQAQQLAVEIIRTSSRGLFWLEPLLEIDSPQGRVGFGPLSTADVPALLAAGLHAESQHPSCIGLIEKLPYLASQQRLLFARAGITQPLSLDDYLAHEGYQGLVQATQLSSAAIVQTVLDSGLRGRGGAAFPAGIKWRTVHDAKAPQKYIVCNADEGDSGSFADRMLLEGDPFLLIEGMTIAALAVGASYGYIYIRSEYAAAITQLQAAIDLARQRGYLGKNLAGSQQAFDLEVRAGAGAYICGEETSLLNSLEGRRGEVRAKPPLPALEGLFGQPTLVHNVLTLASIPLILARGAAYYRDFGLGRSLGTMAFQLAGNVRQGGLVERAFGLTLRELLEDYGAGTASGKPIKAVQVGGPLGAWIAPQHFDTPLDYEAFATIGAMLGHGGVTVCDDSINLGQMARFAMQFCAEESCGKCTPCRIGATRAVEVIDQLLDSQSSTEQQQQVALLSDLCETMQYGSLCALGGMAPFPVQSALRYFPADFGLSPNQQEHTS